MSGPTEPPTRSHGDPSPGSASSRWRAAAAGVLLLLTGAALGVTVDRLWVAGADDAVAAPLTFDAMAQSLELDPGQRERVRAVLDSLERDVAAAAAAGPDSLRATARRARQRLHDVLPPDRRPAFRRWMRLRHRQMMERMHPEGRPPMHMRMHPDDPSPGGMMRPGGGRGPGRGPGPRGR